MSVVVEIRTKPQWFHTYHKGLRNTMVVVLGFETITILSFRFKICLTQDGASRRRRQGRDNSGNDYVGSGVAKATMAKMVLPMVSLPLRWLENW